MPTKFEVGEIVQLKSGGPQMTVKKITEFSDGESIECQWFSGSKLQNGWFNPDSLLKAEDDGKE